jgi:hypothetical protein
MSASHSDQELVNKRVTALCNAYNGHSVDHLMAFYSEDVDFSDFSNYPPLLPQLLVKINSYLLQVSARSI